MINKFPSKSLSVTCFYTCSASISGSLITSVSLVPSNVTATVGSSITLVCIVEFSVPASNNAVEFDYGFIRTTKASSDGSTLFDTVTISNVDVSSAINGYTCTVTVLDLCGGDRSEPACPNKTSNTVIPTVRCE